MVEHACRQHGRSECWPAGEGHMLHLVEDIEASGLGRQGLTDKFRCHVGGVNAVTRIGLGVEDIRAIW